MVGAAAEKAEEPGKQMQSALGPQRAWATAGLRQEPSPTQVFILRRTSRAGLLLLRA